MKIGVACGGTGGHIFPGLVTADVLKRRGHQVTLWLAGRSVEGVSAGGWDGPVVTVEAAGFSSRVSWRWAGAAWALLRALRECRRRMKADRPEVLLAMGSYASVGPVLAARTLGVPVVLHESNAVPGRAIQMLSRLAAAVAVSFEAAGRYLRHARVVTTGFPIRAELDERFEQGVLAADAFAVLVMGGSQGAHTLNVVASDALCRLRARGVAVQAVHLTGVKDEAWVRAKYQQAGVPAVVFGFLRAMGKAYHAADLAITRGGAATCAELAACAVPALIVPLPSARRDHQTANGLTLQVAGGADVMAQKDLTVEWLAGYIESSRLHPGRRDAMRLAMKNIPLADRTGKLADLVEEIGAGGRDHAHL